MTLYVWANVSPATCLRADVHPKIVPLSTTSHPYFTLTIIKLPAVVACSCFARPQLVCNAPIKFYCVHNLNSTQLSITPSREKPRHTAATASASDRLAGVFANVPAPQPKGDVVGTCINASTCAGTSACVCGCGCMRVGPVQVCRTVVMTAVPVWGRGGGGRRRGSTTETAYRNAETRGGVSKGLAKFGTSVVGNSGQQSCPVLPASESGLQ